MEDVEIPELINEQIENLCSTAGNASRKHILSKFSPNITEIFSVITLKGHSEKYLRTLK